MREIMKRFFNSLSVAEVNTENFDVGEVVMGNYMCEDLQAGRKAFCCLTSKSSDAYNNMVYNKKSGNAVPYFLYGFRICVETYKNDGAVIRATISPVYESVYGEFFDTDLTDITRGLNEVLRLMKGAKATIVFWSQVEKAINELVSRELRNNTDNITSSGWKYIERIAPGKTLQRLKEQYRDLGCEDISKEIIERAYQNVLCESRCKIRV